MFHPLPAPKVVSQSSPGIRVGRVEVAYDGADHLVLVEGQGRGGVEGWRGELGFSDS